MKTKSLLLAVLTLTLSTAALANEKEKNGLSAKIEFLYSCPATVHEFTCLEKAGVMRQCRDYAITACGNKYIFTRMGVTWVMTGSNLEASFKQTNLNTTAKANQAVAQGAVQASAASHQIMQATQQASVAASQASMAASQAAMAASQAAMAASQAAMAATPPPQ